tara:strand:+ start:906 stop:1130 length:225 start_codon:yes stop_codon:yes gene_type:complete
MNLELFNINFDNFLMIIITIHIGILLLIGGSALIYGKKTLNYPITRFQLAIIIIFLWLSVFLLFKEKEKKSTEL